MVVTSQPLVWMSTSPGLLGSAKEAPVNVTFSFSAMFHRITVTQRIGAISAVGQNKVQFTAKQKDQCSPLTDLEK